jgi:hypothetical protein
VWPAEFATHWRRCERSYVAPNARKPTEPSTREARGPSTLGRFRAADTIHQLVLRCCSYSDAEEMTADSDRQFVGSRAFESRLDPGARGRRTPLALEAPVTVTSARAAGERGDRDSEPGPAGTARDAHSSPPALREEAVCRGRGVQVGEPS